MFREATSENAVAVFQQAVYRFGAPTTILSDSGLCFVGRAAARGRRAPTVIPDVPDLTPVRV